MVGITSYGAYIPRYRLNRFVIFGAIGWAAPIAPQPGEKAVANYDEDSITMAVAAASDCLNGSDREKIDGLYLATTTSPFKERQCSGIVATALDLRPDIRTADFANSIRAGTIALNSAADTIKAEEAKSILVTAADTRLGAGAGSAEQIFGDGAVALRLGDTGVIATLKGSYSVSYDFMDQWRTENDRFERSWEERWAREEGYNKFIPEVIFGLLKKYDLTPKDFAKVAYPCLSPGPHVAMGRKLGFEPRQIQDPLFTTVGNTGTAHALMVLVAALENAKPGDKILLADYGNGSDAMFFQVTEAIEKARDRRGIEKHLASKRDLESYEKYVHFRKMMPLEAEMGGRSELPPTPVTALWRGRRQILALVGSKCKRCGIPQYPPHKVCVNPACGAYDEREDYRFSDKKARIFTYTADNLAVTPDPPQVYAMIQFEGGGRSLFDVTDCTLEELKVDMPIEMSFRKQYHDEPRGIHNYWWKAVPPRG
jgi:3-hydroxy-3-methylglutaryl CoA synthase